MPNNRQQLHPLQLKFEFSPNTISLQIEMHNGEPIFAAKDICEILDLQNPSERVKSSLDEDEYLTYAVHRAGQSREMLFVTESGLYGLIFQSRKPEAKKFRKWVTNEVLPQIRKTGRYVKGDVLIDPKQIEEILPFVDQMDHEGQTVYAARQLFILLGRKYFGSSNRYFEQLGKDGLAFKLITKDNFPKWYVAKEGIGYLLNIRPTTRENITILKSLKEGGLL